MKNNDVLKAYSDGPDISDLNKFEIPRTRNRCSKLQKHSEFILKFRTEGRSYKFIANHLKKMEVDCNRATVCRFYNQLISM